MKYKYFSSIATLASVEMLGGCAAGNSSFSCDKVAGNGLGCASVMQTYELTNHQQMPSKAKQKAAQQSPIKPQKYSLKAPLPGDPVRFSEQIQRIWIAPFEDSKGIYHEPSYIYMVLKPSHWAGLPVKAVRAGEM